MSRGISIVIPAYNESETLPLTLPTFAAARREFEARFHAPTELIIVDNASTDDTAAVAEKLGARAIRHEVRNIASVRNAGIRAAAHDLVITVDADTFLPAQALTRIWEAMATGKYVGGATRLGISTKRPHVKWMVYVMERAAVRMTGLSWGLYFFWREAALAFGGFPEEQLIAEDIGFAKALRAHGAGLGQKFLCLRNVTIETMDRKESSVPEMLWALYMGFRASIGLKITKEARDFWYKPRR